MFGYIILALVIFGVFYAVSLYNWFQTTLTRIKASIQEIGNQLKRQADLIPNLESSAKGYLKHEKDIYKDITTARKAVEQAVGSSDMSKISKASDQVSALLPKLQVIVESNRDTSDKLMYSRRVVIDLSADFNQKLVVFPSNIVGNMFGFKLQKGLDTPMSGEHLEVSSGETHSPKISL